MPGSDVETLDDPLEELRRAERIGPGRLRDGRAREIALRPDAAALAALAARLGAEEVRKFRFEARLEPEGRTDWRLTGELGATVVQPCVISLAPVTTRVDLTVERRYSACRTSMTCP